MVLFAEENLLNASFQLMIQCNGCQDGENSIALEHSERNSASQKGLQKNESCLEGVYTVRVVREVVTDS